MKISIDANARTKLTQTISGSHSFMSSVSLSTLAVAFAASSMSFTGSASAQGITCSSSPCAVSENTQGLNGIVGGNGGNGGAGSAGQKAAAG